VEKIQMPKFGERKMVFHSDYCEAHYKPIQKMIVKGDIVCPMCEIDKSNKRLEEEMSEYYRKIKQDEKYNTLYNKSVVEDRTLLDARFDNYITECQEEEQNKAIVLECLERYKRGEVFNLILQGKQGTGKSHLGYATLYELNQDRQRSCLFVSVDAMLRKIKNSFNDKESKYTEEYFNRLLSDVDFLVLDDMGAETGAIDTSKTATDFVQRVLYGITNTRQDKATILTTNLDGKTLFSMYDKKLVSRLFKNPKYVIFKDSKDKRTSNIPF
jgi:DNA replication protein DnaC